MYSTINTVKSLAAKALSLAPATEKSPDGGAPPTESSDFDTILKGLLKPDSANKVSEEELFAGLAYERINKLKGKEAAEAYKTALQGEQNALRRADGHIPHEQAAINALTKLTQDGTLTAAEGDSVYAQAFAGAQLDSNTSTLFDNRGGANDPTMAVEIMETALIAAKAMIGGFDDGSKSADPRSLTGAAQTGAKGVGGGAPGTAPALPVGGNADVSPTGQVVDGSGGFLWKPISNNQGTLAVLLPPELTGSISALKLLDSTGNVVEEGRFTSDGTGEGGRTKYSFNKKGGDYGDDLTVRLELSDGSVRTWMIPDGSRRYD
ncbi:MAG: hypothetical protein RL417_96 [Pseudomonadota bacterium]|jgi:hypothetical protein